jgi:hypothetical protein
MSTMKKYRVNTSQVATYGATAPVAGATWVHIPQIGQVKPAYPTNYSDANIANNAGAASMRYVTNKGPFTFALETMFHTGTLGIDGASGDGVIGSYYLESQWDSYWGGVGAHVFAGTTCTGVGTGMTTDLTVTTTAGCVAGQGILVAFAATGLWEFAHIVKVTDGTHLTLDHDLAATPAAADVVYGGHTYMMTTGQRTKADYYLVEMDGHSVLGGPGQVFSAKLAGLAAGSDLRIQMGVECADWVQSGTGHTVSTALAPTSFVKNAFTGSPIIAKGGMAIINGTRVCMADGGVDFGVTHEWNPCASGTNGRDNPSVVSVEKPTISIVEPYLAARKIAEEVGTGFPMMIAHSVGSTAAAAARGGFSVFFPNAQTTSPEAQYGQSQLGMASAFEGRTPAESPVANIAANLTQPVYFTIFGGKA